MPDNQNQALVPYGYSILDYARQFDSEWIVYLKELKTILGLKQQQQQQRQTLSDSPKAVPSQRRERKEIHLPDETLFELLSYLDAASLLVATQVNRLWMKQAQRSLLWEKLLLHDFHISVNAVRLFAQGGRAKYGKRCPKAKVIYWQMWRGWRALAGSGSLSSVTM
eukprot:gene10308-11408_t